MTGSRFRARPKVVAKQAASDGAIGVVVGLSAVCVMAACNLDLRDSLLQSGAPVSSLLSLAGLACAEAAVLAGIGGAAWRRFLSAD